MRRRLVAHPGVPLSLAAASIVGGVAAASGTWSLSLIDQAVLLGIGVVLPMALGGRWTAWSPAYAGVLGSFLLPTGPQAALLVLPLVLVTGMATTRRVPPGLGRHRPTVQDTVGLLVAAYAFVAAGALVQSRLGASLLGIHEPIVELTAVHYIFAGSGALVLAGAAAAEAGEALGGGRLTSRLGTGALLLTASAPPIVALGFVTRNPALQVGGAIAMTLGVFATATLQLGSASARLATPANRRRGTGLLAVSGLAPWLPMGLAVAWAAGQHWDVPALSIPDMARVHGLTNALGFVVCGLVARRLQAPSTPVRRPRCPQSPAHTTNEVVRL